ncbi:MAG: LysE family translocator [Rhizobiales bacterium]|nr:LysE family translocator [Hyphomicrobiales bacterium]OJY03858.1 MAG: hypothetical protein BGP07_08030 [Rhizobiales bacterium 63-22]
MLNTGYAAAYLLMSLGLILSPGPDTIFVVANGIRYRIKGAIVAALGIAVGTIFHALAAALGVAALIAASPLAFAIIRYAGAAYLCWLGLKILLSLARAKSAESGTRDQPLLSLGAVFRRAVVTNLLNPKMPLFYIAILPQFVDPSLGHVGLQMFMLSCMSNVIGTIYLVCIGCVAGRLRALPGSKKVGRWLDGIAASLFIGLGVRLALQRS